MQAAHVVLQQFAVGAADRGEFLHADLNRARQILDVFLGGVGDRLLGAQADQDLGAQRGGQQDHDDNQ